MNLPRAQGPDAEKGSDLTFPLLEPVRCIANAPGYCHGFTVYCYFYYLIYKYIDFNF